MAQCRFIYSQHGRPLLFWKVATLTFASVETDPFSDEDDSLFEFFSLHVCSLRRQLFGHPTNTNMSAHLHMILFFSVLHWKGLHIYGQSMNWETFSTSRFLFQVS
jgi:hypothetical protein